jgi:pimeloyl-ACP methyl ester carboxylesterase
MAKTTLRQRRETGIGPAQERLAAALFPDGVQAFDVRERLARFAGPVKIIFGLDDRIIPAHHAHGLPGAIAVHLFANIGHMPHFETRDEIAQLIQDNVAAGEQRA